MSYTAPKKSRGCINFVIFSIELLLIKHDNMIMKMGKKILIVLSSSILVITLNIHPESKSGYCEAASCNKVLKFWLGKAEFTIDGRKYLMSNAPEILHGRMFIPLRGPLACAGGDVSYSDRDKCMGYSFSQMYLQMWVGKNTASVRNFELETTETMQIDPLNPNIMPYFSKANTAMVPVRFIAQIFGITTEYNNKEKSVTIKLISDCPGSACSRILKFWENKLEYELDGVKKKDIVCVPEKKSGKLFIPVNIIMKSYPDPDKMDISWNDKEKSLWFTWTDNIVIKLWVGKNKAEITYRGIMPIDVEIDADPSILPYINNGKIMAPVDFFSKYIGDGIIYDDKEKSVMI